MNELEIKYKQALTQLGGAFDAIFTLNAKLELLAAKVEQLEKAAVETKFDPAAPETNEYGGTD